MHNLHAKPLLVLAFEFYPFSGCLHLDSRESMLYFRTMSNDYGFSFLKNRVRYAIPKSMLLAEVGNLFKAYISMLHVNACAILLYQL